jgi:hypothetical protein
MSRAVGRRLVFTAVLLLATPLAALARPIEGALSPGVNFEQVWSRLLEWFGTVGPKAVWGEQGADISPNGTTSPGTESDAGSDITPLGTPAPLR